MIVAIVNLKGGVGKTTSAIALATAASRQGLEVRVLDADPQGSATMGADLAEEAGEPLPFEVGPANVTTARPTATSRMRQSPSATSRSCRPARPPSTCSSPT